MSGNITNCPGDTITKSNLPPGWYETDVILCGSQYAQETPLQNFSSCCAGAPQVYNGCLQYCQVDNVTNFDTCFVFQMVSKANAFECNKMVNGKSSGASIVPGGGWLAGIALLAVLLKIVC